MTLCLHNVLTAEQEAQRRADDESADARMAAGFQSVERSIAASNMTTSDFSDVAHEDGAPIQLDLWLWDIIDELFERENARADSPNYVGIVGEVEEVYRSRHGDEAYATLEREQRGPRHLKRTIANRIRRNLLCNHENLTFEIEALLYYYHALCTSLEGRNFDREEWEEDGLLSPEPLETPIVHVRSQSPPSNLGVRAPTPSPRRVDSPPHLSRSPPMTIPNIPDAGREDSTEREPLQAAEPHIPYSDGASAPQYRGGGYYSDNELYPYLGYTSGGDFHASSPPYHPETPATPQESQMDYERQDSSQAPIPTSEPSSPARRSPTPQESQIDHEPTPQAPILTPEASSAHRPTERRRETHQCRFQEMRNFIRRRSHSVVAEIRNAGSAKRRGRDFSVKDRNGRVVSTVRGADAFVTIGDYMIFYRNA